jgi:hypothetical protein
MVDTDSKWSLIVVMIISNSLRWRSFMTMCFLTCWLFGIFQSFSRTKDMTWRPDLFSDSMAASGIETGTKLYISNLDYRVSNEDIKVGEAS